MISILTFESPHGSYTDASAVAAWLDRGDEAAAEWLFEKYIPLVRHICSRRLPRLWMVEDTSEDTMSRAFLSLQNFDVTRCFSSWLGSIAVHACADELRCHSRQSEIAVDDMDLSVGYCSDTNRDERIAIVRELVEALPQGVIPSPIDKKTVEKNK